jgi:hypothetical protein
MDLEAGAIGTVRDELQLASPECAFVTYVV